MNMHILSHIRIHIAVTLCTDLVWDVNGKGAHILANTNFSCDLATVHYISLPQALDPFYLIIYKQLFEFCHL